MPNENSIDFGGALLLMRSGIPVKRLAWDSRRPIDRKYKIEIVADESGQRLMTTYINYASDRGVLSTDDLLAKDWIEADT